MAASEPAAALALALAMGLAWLWDARWGEPANAWHPVAWLGRVLGPVGRWLLRVPPGLAFFGGAGAWCVASALAGGAAWALQQAVAPAPWYLAAPLLALVLKPMFAWRMLHDEVLAVLVALPHSPVPSTRTGPPNDDELAAARSQLARLVSRDLQTLDADGLRETALETLSENLNDSVVAPLFWFAVFGLPGAVVYRVANTADAMWGYRGPWEWAGKWAARADDLLSWLPARLTGLALAPLRCWSKLPAQARLTPSPNGGWPMGALALRLGVRLRKPGAYALNEKAASPTAADARAALRATAAVAWLAATLAGAAWAVRA